MDEDRKGSTRREFLKTAGMGAAALSLGPQFQSSKAKSGADRRPNILFVQTCYQAGEDGPSLGSPFLEMPNLDQLCEEGVVFNRHYCTAPICTPSRDTLITGQYPHTHGQWDNYDSWIPEDSPVLMKRLGEAGYQSAGIGKMHFRPWDRMAGFDHRIIADNKGNARAANQLSDEKLNDDYAQFLAQHDMTRWDYLKKRLQGDVFGVYDWPYEERLHIDHYVGEQTVRFLEEGRLQHPWFLWVSFNGPHNPWDPPAEYSAPYKRMDLPSARARPGELHDKPPDHTRLRYNYTREVPDRIDQASPSEQTEIIERIRAGHYGSLTFVDHQLGRILQALERNGELENTIVIFSSDHGAELGDHHNIHKGLHYERSARVPFVVWCPERYDPREVDSFSTNVDILPTILSLAGTEIPEGAPGYDLTPLLTGQRDRVQEHAISEIRRSTAIITERWKMSVYPRDGVGALYDREEDPDELYNRYDDSAYKHVRKELTRKLTEFHPPLAEEIEQMEPTIFVEQDEYSFESGEHLAPEEAPYQRGKAVTIVAKLAPRGSSWSAGPILETNVGEVHGYALFIDDEERLGFGLRRWRADTVVLTPEQLPTEEVSVQVHLDTEGLVRLMVNGKPVSAAEAEGTLPEQPGHERITAGHVHCGKGPSWRVPIGNYLGDAVFDGKIRQVMLRLGE